MGTSDGSVIAAVIAFSISGASQFSPGFRRRRRGWHRIAGRILIPRGLIVALSGLWMVQFYLERLAARSAMLLSILLGVQAIRRRDFALHGEEPRAEWTAATSDRCRCTWR